MFVCSVFLIGWVLMVVIFFGKLMVLYRVVKFFGVDMF